MTSTKGLQITPGQQCLLDLTQRKLVSVMEAYTNLSLSKESGAREHIEHIEEQLLALKEKLRRISARQKRFTLEIINGNGNNTIPKESFFEALGLVTKEALSKLNSKTNERRRRTTANPRFSHEAIQAKRALEPVQKRLEPRVSRDKRESAKKPAQRAAAANTNNNIQSGSNNKTSSSNNINNSYNANNNNNTIGTGGGRSGNQQVSNYSANASTRTSNRSNRRNLILQQKQREERRKLLNQFDDLQTQIHLKVSQIREKREANRKLEKQNDSLRKRGLEMINVFNNDPDLFLDDLPTAANRTNHNTRTGDGQSANQSEEPLDIWIDMKCDESLDELD